MVNKIIYDAYLQKASDIHIEPYPGKKDIIVRMRVDGKCSVYQKLPSKYKYAIVSRIKIMAELDIAERRRPQAAELNEIIKEFGVDEFAAADIDKDSILLARAVGCDRCQNSGYKGRIGIHELLECSDGIKSLIKTKSETSIIRRQAILEGMTSLKQDGMLKVMQGLTEIQEIRRVCIR